jgi:prepilin signal peptidase PulO-like enzyme (type II secretory pathway)
MTPRTRLLSFGAAALLIVLGVIAGPVLGGITGEAVAIALLSIGAIAIVSLVFLEVGLSEDRERARERAVRAVRQRPPRRRRRPD